MEPIKLGYSFKNIPMHCNETIYNCKLYEMASRFINRVRRKVHWFGKEDDSEKNEQKYNVFRARTTVEPIDELKQFEKEFFEMIGNIEFRRYSNDLSKRIKDDVNQIRKCNKVIMFADKSSNLYKIEKEQYDKLLHENVTKEYKKAPDTMIKDINDEAQDIIYMHKIKGKIPKYELQEAFITVKDHKKDFPNKIQCRLLNPSKSHMAKISKSILDRINNCIRKKSNLIQWRNTNEVLDWFKVIDGKQNKSFVKFDIESFYPNISRNTFMKAIVFARKFVDVSEDDVDIIIHSCRTVLNYNGSVWVKKNDRDNFDVPMGSYHGAELCELIGLFMLEKLRGTFDIGSYGIYRDDGLAVVDNKTPGQLERLVKKVHKIFKDQGFNITIEKELKRTEFLDTILDLTNNMHRPYRKPNTEVTYVSNLSNHPKHIRRHIPDIINKRLSLLSSSEAAFNLVKDDYEQALKKSDYAPNVRYDETPTLKKTRKRRRKIIYFQPPYSASVKTPIGKLFLKLVKKHFHVRHPFYKILNPKCLKLSYSCLPNVKSMITSNNRKVINGDDKLETKRCNCQKSRTCPVNGKCQLDKVVYKADIVNVKGETRTYIGSTGNTFKERHKTHKATLKEKDHPRSTAMSRHYWKTKTEDKKEPQVKWEIINQTRATVSERFGCMVCNLEKIAIAKADKDQTLNKRNELVASCPHFSSKYFKKPKEPKIFGTKYWAR